MRFEKSGAWPADCAAALILERARNASNGFDSTNRESR